MKIRISTKADRTEICNVHKMAFGEEKGPVIAELVNGIFDDKTATPLYSIVAVDDDKIVGHIFYTKVDVINTKTEIAESVSAQILAPLAVLPEAQNTGVGTLLIKEGLEQLKKAGVELVFVLGHPDYYPRLGFVPVRQLGYDAPYNIPEEYADAWMVQELSAGIFGKIKGRVRCSEVLNQPEHWVK